MIDLRVTSRSLLVVVAVGALLMVGCSGDPDTNGRSSERSNEQAGASTPASGHDEQASGGGVQSASGSGVATYDGERYPFEVIACGWMTESPDGPDLQLSGERNDRELFIFAGVRREDDGFFFVGLQWLDRANIEAAVAHQGTPQFMASSGLNAASDLEIDGGRIQTLRPLSVLSGPAQSEPLEVEATCDRFGGSMGGMVELLEEATGQQVTTPGERGGGGTLTVDGEEVAVQVDSCDQQEERVTVEATAPDGTYLYLVAYESIDDQVVMGRDEGSIGADASGDLIIVEGDRLRSAHPIELGDRVDDTPAQTITFDVTCGASG